MNYLTFALEIAQLLFLVTVQRCWIDAAYHQLRQPVDEYVFNIRAVEEGFPMLVMMAFDLDLVLSAVLCRTHAFWRTLAFDFHPLVPKGYATC
jgi:hypothetical protein